MSPRVIDLSRKRLRQADLVRIEDQGRKNWRNPKTYYRLSKEQVLDIVRLIYAPDQFVQEFCGKRKVISEADGQELARKQAGNLYDIYSSFSAGTYYFSPPHADFPLNPSFQWLSRKRFDGFVTRNVGYHLHIDAGGSGGAIETPDRMMQFPSSMHKHSSVFADTKPIDREELRRKVLDYFQEDRLGRPHRFSCSRSGGDDLGFLPLTAFIGLKSGEEVFDFIERFLGFKEIEVPYSEEAYCLQFAHGQNFLPPETGYGEGLTLQQKVLARIKQN